MRSVMVETLRSIADLLFPDSIQYQGVLLPGKHFRLCGRKFLSDEYFLTSAIREAERCIEHLGLTRHSRVLDVGCGVGRLPIGILKRAGEIDRYVGIDIREKAIRWCQHYLSPSHPTFQFIWLDLKNLRYNPRGQSFFNDFRFPFNDQEFDIIYLYSVFTHMGFEDIQKYLVEFRRILNPKGKIFLTAFIEEGVPNMSINPKRYRKKWTGALHCVRYDKDFFERLLYEVDLGVNRFDYGQEMGGMSGLYISIRDGA